MGVYQISLLSCAVLLVILHITVASFFPEEFRSEKRRWVSPPCRRCMNNPEDWTNCMSCYNKITPFQGKRAFNPYELSSEKRVYNPYEFELDKKAFNPYDLDYEKRAYNPYEWDYTKRAFNPYDSDIDKRAFNPYELADAPFVDKKAYNPYDFYSQGSRMEKRGFRDCKCCLVTGDEKCCSKCDFVPYYGGSVQKRAYMTSFFEPSGGNYCSSCCRHSTFNFYCCIKCNVKKK